MAYLLAQCAPPLKLPDKQPTAYSYNGVVLPDIHTVYTPELQETHPFAYIEHYALGLYSLYVASQQAIYNPKTYIAVPPRVEGFGNCIKFQYAPEYDETWKLKDEKYDGSIFLDDDNTLLWCNTPVYNVTDGTLYLAASDPIPVGSAPEVEPKSFMAGWRMGQIVKCYGIGI